MSFNDVIVVSAMISCAEFVCMFFNPLSPHDALNHHFTSLKTYLIFSQGFYKANFDVTVLRIHDNFL